jgi:hypothetical protein
MLPNSVSANGGVVEEGGEDAIARVAWKERRTRGAQSTGLS